MQIQAPQLAPSAPCRACTPRPAGRPLDQVQLSAGLGNWFKRKFGGGDPAPDPASAPAGPSVPVRPAGPAPAPGPTAARVDLDDPKIRPLLQRMESIGKSFGDEQMTWKPSERWSYNPATNQGTYVPGDLVEKSDDYVIGKALQESALARYSPYCVEPELANNETFHYLANSVEEPAASELVASRYAGARSYLKEVYEEDILAERDRIKDRLATTLAEESQGKLTPEQARTVVEKSGLAVPRHIQYGMGVMRDWYTGGQPDPDIQDPTVKKALEESLPDAREAIRLKREVFRDDLTPLEAREQAEERYHVVRDKLYPTYQRLVEQDRQSLQQALQGKPQQQLQQQQQNSCSSGSCSSGQNGKSGQAGQAGQTSQNQAGQTGQGQAGQTGQGQAGQAGQAGSAAQGNPGQAGSAAQGNPGQALQRAGQSMRQAGQTLSQAQPQQAGGNELQQAGDNLRQAGGNLEQAGQTMQQQPCPNGSGNPQLQQAAQQLQQAGRQLQQAGRQQSAGSASQEERQAALQQAMEQLQKDPAARQQAMEQLKKNPEALQQAMQQLQQDPQARQAMEQAARQLEGNPAAQQALREAVQQLQQGQQPQSQPQPGQAQQDQPQDQDKAASDTPRAGAPADPQAMQQAMQQLQNNPEAMQKAMQQLQNNPEAMQKAMQQLQNNPEAMQKAMQQLQQDPQAMQQAARQLGQDPEKLKEAMQKLQQDPEALKQAMQQLQQDPQAMQQAGRQLQQAAEKLEQAARESGPRAEQKLQQAGQDLERAGRQLEQLGKQLGQKGDPNGKQLEQAGRELQQAGQEAQQGGPQQAQQQQSQGGSPSGQAGQPGQGQPAGAGSPGGQPGANGEAQPGGQAGAGQPGAAKPGGQPGAGQPGGSASSTGLPNLTPEQAEELARKVLERLNRELNEQLESKDDSLRRGGQAPPRSQPPSSGLPQGQPGAAPPPGAGKAEGQAPPPEGPPPVSEAPPPVENAPGGGNGYEIFDPNLKLPDLEELIEQKRLMEAEWEKQRSNYDRYHSKVAKYSDELSGRLRNFLRRTRNPKYNQRATDRGRKLSIKAAMQTEAKADMTGRQDGDIWLDRSKPTKRGYEFVFILDGSGSMIGDRWNSLLLATVLCAEALDSLDINFGVVEYSDSARVFKNVKEKYDLEGRNRLWNAIERPFSGGNNERVALETSLELLEKQGTKDYKKVMLLITDGICDIGPVKELTKKAKDKGIILIGVGIGAEMKQVLDTYDDHVVVEHLEKLPYALADVVRQQIEGEDDKFA